MQDFCHLPNERWISSFLNIAVMLQKHTPPNVLQASAMRQVLCPAPGNFQETENTACLISSKPLPLSGGRWRPY
jgi:hypothetical protein